MRECVVLRRYAIQILRSEKRFKQQQLRGGDDAMMERYDVTEGVELFEDLGPRGEKDVISFSSLTEGRRGQKERDESWVGGFSAYARLMSPRKGVWSQICENFVNTPPSSNNLLSEQT